MNTLSVSALILYSCETCPRSAPTKFNTRVRGSGFKPIFQTSIHPANFHYFFTFPGQWWYQRARYVEKNVSLGCHGLPHCDKKIGFPDPYLKALAHVMRGSLTIPGFNGTVVYRSFSPEHFENGNWDTGGECVRTTPGGVSMSYDTDHMYGIQKKSFKNVTGHHHYCLLQ